MAQSGSQRLHDWLQARATYMQARATENVLCGNYLFIYMFTSTGDKSCILILFVCVKYIILKVVLIMMS